MVYPLPGGSFSCDFLVSPAARKSGKCFSRLMPPHRLGGVRGVAGGPVRDPRGGEISQRRDSHGVRISSGLRRSARNGSTRKSPE